MPGDKLVLPREMAEIVDRLRGTASAEEFLMKLLTALEEKRGGPATKIPVFTMAEVADMTEEQLLAAVQARKEPKG